MTEMSKIHQGTRPTRKAQLMSITDDAKNLAQEAKGNIKEGAGKVSDNERLEAEGKGLMLLCVVKRR